MAKRIVTKDDSVGNVRPRSMVNNKLNRALKEQRRRAAEEEKDADEEANKKGEKTSKKRMFTLGGPGGPGRPKGSSPVQRWRWAFASAITPDDVKDVALKLLSYARDDGEKWAITELLDRCVGSPAEADLEDQVRKLEKLIRERIPDIDLGSMTYPDQDDTDESE
jgi:hypothetical protein